MRSLLQNITDRLRSFISQSDDFGLILTFPETDAPPLLKIVEQLSEESTSRLFWTFTERFTEPDAYASAIVGAFETQYEALRLSMEMETGTELPLFPASIQSDGHKPVARLRKLIQFSRSLLPAPGQGHVVWGLLPLEIEDGVSYTSLIMEMLEHELPYPWCHNVRLIVRADPTCTPGLAASSDPPRIQQYQPDLSLDSMRAVTESDIHDDGMPLNERMEALMVHAGTSYSYGRHDEALEAYQLLLQYHASTGNHPMTALAMNGLGGSASENGGFGPSR